MIIINSLEECIDVVNNLSFNTYNKMLPFIKENFKKAQNYTSFKLNEEAILNLN